VCQPAAAHASATLLTTAQHLLLLCIVSPPPRLEIKNVGGADQPTIPVAELIKLAEPAASAKVAAEVKA
jgi:hypothetical protein